MNLAAASSPRTMTHRQRQTADDVDRLFGQHLTENQQHHLQPVTQLVQPSIEARDAQAVTISTVSAPAAFALRAKTNRIASPPMRKLTMAVCWAAE